MAEGPSGGGAPPTAVPPRGGEHAPLAATSAKEVQPTVPNPKDSFFRGRRWWDIQPWAFEHSPDAVKFRDSQSIGKFPYSNTYFGGVYDKYGLVPNRGTPRVFPQPHPLERRGRYGTITFEGRALNAVMEMYMQGKMIRVGYLAALGALAYTTHYLTRLDSVELPEDFKQFDVTGTGTSHMARFYLPDFKLLNAGAADADGYLKKYTAAVFSCWGYWPCRKPAGMYDIKYYARAYHLHYRRRVVPGEFFSEYEVLQKERTTALLRSELFGSLVQTKAYLDEQGCLTLQLSTTLPEDHWSQQWNGTFMGDNVVNPASKMLNLLWTRFWMTSSCNFFLRHHCSEVYVKPLSAAQNLHWMDSLA